MIEDSEKKHPLDIPKDEISLDELFDKDPVFMSDKEIERIVAENRKQRVVWEQKEKVKKPRAKKVKKTPAEIAAAKASIMDVKIEI